MAFAFDLIAECQLYGVGRHAARLLDLVPGVVLEAAQRHRESLKNPAKTVGEYLLTLETQGLTQTGCSHEGLVGHGISEAGFSGPAPGFA